MSAGDDKVSIDRIEARHTSDILTCGGPLAGRMLRFGIDQATDGFQGIHPTLCPDLSLRVSTIEDAYLLVRPGEDGVVFDGKGNLIYETCTYTHFAKTEHDLKQLEEKAELLSQPMLLTFDGSWRNYYHWMILGLGKAMLYERYCDHHYAPIIYDPKDRGNFVWPLGFSDTVWRESLRRSGVLDKGVVLKMGLYKIPLLDIMWISTSGGQSVDQPPFITLFPELYACFDEVAEQAHRPEGLNIIIARRHDPRLSKTTSEALSLLVDFAGFKSVVLEDLDFEAQLDLFKKAKLVVAPHGAGLANLVYLPTSAIIVELNQCINGEVGLRPWFFLMAATRGHPYCYLDMDTFHGAPRDIYNRLVELASL